VSVVCVSLTTSSGLLLHPSRPATAIDAQILQVSLSDVNSDAQILQVSLSDVNSDAQILQVSLCEENCYTFGLAVFVESLCFM